MCEEVLRFIICDRRLTAGFKHARHSLDAAVKSYRKDPRLLEERESRADVGRTVKSASEFRRSDWNDILSANLQRVKESIRVLEEFSKLTDTAKAESFKSLRYAVYELEKQVSRVVGKGVRRKA